MSRTLKDRPYWVVQNDRSLGTVEHHNHLGLGRTYTVIKDPGTPVDVPTGEVRRTYSLDPSGRTRVTKVPVVERRWQGRTFETVTAPQSCTASHSYPKPRDGAHWSSQPCTTEVPQHLMRHRGCRCRPSAKRAREEYHAPMRRREREAMREFLKAYNTDGDVDDSAWQHTAHRHAPISGYWWD